MGSVADITAFSFFPTKNITTAEGGAVAARDAATLLRAREFARQGIIRDSSRHVVQDQGPWHQEVHEFGLNYRLPDVLAALGSQQLRRLGAFKARRSVIKATYDSVLTDVDGVDVPAQREYVDPTWHLYPLRVPSGRRRTIFERLRSAGIGVQVNYLPAYWHPVFADLGYPRGLCPNAERFYSREISLPMYAALDDEEIRFVGDTVASLVRD